MRRALISVVLGVGLIAVGAHVMARQGGVKPFTDADWPRFAGDFAGTKYSKLTEINTGNVSRLAAAWTFAGVGTQQTPIVVSGIMYASTPSGVVALDADTGSVIWRYGTVPAAGGGGRGGRGGGRGAPGAARGGGGGPAPAGNPDAPQEGEPAAPPAAAPQAGAAPRLAALPLAAGLVPPAQVLQLLHRPEVEDAEALCLLPPAPAAHPRAAALPTGPAMERSRRAS